MMKTAVKERPILFSSPMVKAILAGHKTMTRRVVKPQPPEGYEQTEIPCSRVGGIWAWDFRGHLGFDCSRPEFRKTCPYGQPGDRLWVRETVAINDTCRPSEPMHFEAEIRYRADGGVATTAVHIERWRTAYENNAGRWSSSIHMPRWASRITLEITGVRVERLQDISIEDVIAEGYAPKTDGDHAGQYWREDTGLAFADSWDKLNGPRGFGWDANPWVWIVEFRRVQGGEV